MTEMKILSPARRRAFDSVPKLTKNERDVYLSLNKESRRIVVSLKSPANKVGFLIQRAYFQAKGRFFNSNQFKSIDIKAAIKILGVKSKVDLSTYTNKTASHHKKLILNCYKWRAFSKEDVDNLKSHALLHVDKQLSSEDTLFALLDYCWSNKIEIPGYAKLSEIVSSGYQEYENRIVRIVEEKLTRNQIDTLTGLLEKPKVVERFSEIKRIDQSNKQRKLNRNAEILNFMKNNYHQVEPLLEHLDLSNEAIKHFSNQVYISEVNQLKRLKNRNLTFLYMSAFVKDQFCIRQDYAVDAFLKVMKGVINKSKGFDRKRKEENEKEIEQANQSVLNSAKNSHQVLRLIIEISTNAQLSLAEKNRKVRHLAESFFEAENPNLAAHMQKVTLSLEDSKLKTNYYKYLFAQSDALQKSLSPLIRVLEFDKINSNKSLIKAIEFFRSGGKNIDEKTPTAFLSKGDLLLLEAEDNIPKISRYKILLFSYIEAAIKNRSLSLVHSYRYLANRSYMISDYEWEAKKDELLRAANLLKYKDGTRIIDKMGKTLTTAYKRVNDNFLKRKNPFLSFDRKGKWHLKSSEAEFDSSKYIPGLLNNSKFKLLYELLSEVDYHTEFSEKFSHSSNKNVKTTKENKLIYATLMSLGTNLGHNNMAKATKDISIRDLRETDRLWFDSKNIESANESIVKVIQSLPLPTLFNDKAGVIHTSNDGSKVVVAVNSLLANYSYKYYGKEQGVSVNSFIDEKQTFFHVNVLTSSDREAPYVLDGLANTKEKLFNDSEIEHIHSTDNHGYTEAIFAGLHFLDISFAPRIPKMNEQAIYAFESKSLRKNSKSPLSPNTQIRKKLILKNWDDILRLMTTIKLKRCSGSLIFKALSASKKDNELYKALKEFGRLIKSKFILDYIDDESLRKSIQKQLNRAELGQKMSRAIFFGRAGRLQVGLHEDIQKAVACKTLLKNAIILWNYMFLSDHYRSLESDEEKRHVAELISNGSVIAWAHINMHGLYIFNKKFKSSFKASLREMKSIKVTT